MVEGVVRPVRVGLVPVVQEVIVQQRPAHQGLPVQLATDPVGDAQGFPGHVQAVIVDGVAPVLPEALQL